ncbi:MAG: DUF881 domain-containing protein [Bacillota bacterium]|nr:DUF881 domain-containing protein [Bacillota bacterium]
MQQNKKIIFLVIFTILGLMASLQIKSIIYANNKIKSQSLNDTERLKSEIQKEKDIGKALTKQVSSKEKTKEENLKNAISSRNDDSLKKLKDQVDAVNLKAGLTDVKGSGVIITLDDAEARISEDESTLILHDKDLVRVINELKKANAQAISINDERVTGLTENVCAGPTIMINRRKYTTPFEIKAIGDSEALYNAANDSKIVFYLRRDNIRVSLKKESEITIPKFNSSNIDSLLSGLEVIGE